MDLATQSADLAEISGHPVSRPGARFALKIARYGPCFIVQPPIWLLLTSESHGEGARKFQPRTLESAAAVLSAFLSNTRTFVSAAALENRRIWVCSGHPRSHARQLANGRSHSDLTADET